jgi:hypothetical protein
VPLQLAVNNYSGNYTWLQQQVSGTLQQAVGLLHHTLLMAALLQQCFGTTLDTCELRCMLVLAVCEPLLLLGS